MSVEGDCPICNSSQNVKEQFATAKVAEHIKEKARHDDEHQRWIDKHTDDGTLAEIRAALQNESLPG